MTPMEQTLRDATVAGAIGLATAASGLLALAVLGELLGQTCRARRLGNLLGRLTPPAARRAAAVLVAALAPVVLSSRAAADDGPSVRGWLRGPAAAPSPVVSSTTLLVATPGALDARSAPGPVVLPPSSQPGAPASTGGPRAPAPAATTEPTTGAPAPSPTAPAPTAPTAAPPPSPTETYVVKRGDCLWSIAARHLPGRPTNAAIDTAWRRLYAINRAAVGPDPNLIHPGLVLEVPAFDAAR